DPATADARRAAAAGTTDSDLLWTGASDGAQARVVGVPAGPGLGPALAPGHLHLTLIDPGVSAADTDPLPAQPFGGGAAYASTNRPQIYTRAQWGADESLRKHACPNGPDYNKTVKVGFIHHTDTPNGYTRAEVPRIIRSIYAYHVQ